MKFAIIENDVVVDIIEDDVEIKDGKREPKTRKPKANQKAHANDVVNKGDRWVEYKGAFYRKLTKTRSASGGGTP